MEAILIVFSSIRVEEEALKAAKVGVGSEAARQRAHACTHQNVRRPGELIYISIGLCKWDDVVDRKYQKLRQLGHCSDDASEENSRTHLIPHRRGGADRKVEPHSDECFKCIVKTRRQHKATTGSYRRHERVCRGERPKEVELELMLLKAELVGIVRVGRGSKQLEPRAQLIVLHTDWETSIGHIPMVVQRCLARVRSRNKARAVGKPCTRGAAQLHVLSEK